MTFLWVLGLGLVLGLLLGALLHWKPWRHNWFRPVRVRVPKPTHPAAHLRRDEAALPPHGGLPPPAGPYSGPAEHPRR